MYLVRKLLTRCSCSEPASTAKDLSFSMSVAFTTRENSRGKNKSETTGCHFKKEITETWSKPCAMSSGVVSKLVRLKDQSMIH